MIVRFADHEFEFTNPIISIGSISFDVRKAEEWNKNRIISNEGELARLYLNLLGWPEKTITTPVGETATIPERRGIDIATASYDDIYDYLNNPPEKMSESLNELLRMVLKVKSPAKFKNEINNVSQKLKKEYELIDKHDININTLGQCGGGVLGKVRMDGSK